MRVLLAALGLLISGVASANTLPCLGSDCGSRTNSAGAAESEPVYESPCQTDYDYHGNFIYHPESGCCTDDDCQSTASGTKPYKRWTPACVATAPGQPFILLGSDNQTTLGLAGTFKPDSSSCFALDVVGGSYSKDNWIAYNEAITDIAAANNITLGPRILHTRNDLTDEYDLGTSEPDMGLSFSRTWIMETARVWDATPGVAGGTGVIDFIQGLVAPGDGTTANFTRCRFPSVTYDANDAWDASPLDSQSGNPSVSTGDCDHDEYLQSIFTASGTSEAARKLKNYYVFFRDTALRMIYAVAALTDVTNPNYRAWFVRYAELNMRRGHMDAFLLSNKFHHYWNLNYKLYLQNWIATGDALGGAGWQDCDPNFSKTVSGAYIDPVFTASSATDILTYPTGQDIPDRTEINVIGSSLPGATPALGSIALGVQPTSYWTIRQTATSSQIATSLANAIAGTEIDLTSNGSGTMNIGLRYFTTFAQLFHCDALRTGPPLIVATDSDFAAGTEFKWPQYASGWQKIAHEAYTHSPRIPCYTDVNVYAWAGCTAGVTMPSDFNTGTGCTNKFDDPSTGANEAALVRQGVQECGYVTIDTQGQGSRAVDCSGSPCVGGIGSGGGIGLTSAQLKTMIESGTPAPIRIEIIDTSSPSWSTTPKISTYAAQINPEAAITPALDPECSNGVDDDADGLTDYPADWGCYGAADADETNPTPADCNDRVDNDGDGFIDWPADVGCFGDDDTTETPG